MYRYYCIMRPPAPGAIPRLHIFSDFKVFDKRRYIPEIDRMAWGWVEYMNELPMRAVANYELIAAPREDE